MTLKESWSLTAHGVGDVIAEISLMFTFIRFMNHDKRGQLGLDIHLMCVGFKYYRLKGYWFISFIRVESTAAVTETTFWHPVDLGLLWLATGKYGVCAVVTRHVEYNVTWFQLDDWNHFTVSIYKSFISRLIELSYCNL